MSTKDAPENTWRHKHKCPYCGYECDAATSLDEPNAMPEVGSIAFCLKCVRCFEFGPDMNTLKFDLDTIENLDERIRLKVLQLNMLDFFRKNPEIKIGKKNDH